MRYNKVCSERRAAATATAAARSRANQSLFARFPGTDDVYLRVHNNHTASGENNNNEIKILRRAGVCACVRVSRIDTII